MALLVFKTSVGPGKVPGGFDSHSPPPFFAGRRAMNPSAPASHPVRRTFAASLLVSAGAFMLVFGAMGHHQTVTFERETRETPPPPPPGAGPGLEPGEPGMPGLMGSQEAPSEIVVRRTVSTLKAEPELVLEVARSGLARTPEGVLRLTYTGTPQARCPT